MFLLSFFASGRIGDYYFFTVESAQFWFAVLTWGALLMMIPWLGNVAQPEPKWGEER